MRRLVFVTGEYTNNSGGVDQALTLSEMQAGDKNSTKLWWDAK
jgi:hypothetical protein